MDDAIIVDLRPELVMMAVLRLVWMIVTLGVWWRFCLMLERRYEVRHQDEALTQRNHGLASLDRRAHPGTAKVSPSPPVVLENENVEINLGAQEIPTPATSDYTFAAEAVSKG